MGLWRVDFSQYVHSFLRVKEKALSTPVGPGQLASRMGIQSGFLVLERGFGDDSDDAIRKEISAAAGNELLDENSQEVVDLVMSWWREDDGDLTDELVDCLTYLSETGPISSLTKFKLIPKFESPKGVFIEKLLVTGAPSRPTH